MNYLLPAKAIVIGASTGGPGQIEKIINSLPILTDTTVIIAQHMVIGFIPSFVKRLRERSINPINMAEDNTVIKTGHIYLCSGYTSVIKKNQQLFFAAEPPQENKYNPNINAIFGSLASYTREVKLLGVILTGIGNDGVDGCKLLSLNGARTITESEKSAIVDGMPCRARKEIPTIEISDINEIVNNIKEFCK